MQGSHLGKGYGQVEPGWGLYQGGGDYGWGE